MIDSELLELPAETTDVTKSVNQPPIVLWINSMHDPDWYGLRETKYYIFELGTYEKIAPRGNVEDLPRLSCDEIKQVFPFNDLPEAPSDVPNLCLYRLPDSEKDPYGDFIVETLRSCFADSGSLQMEIVDEPATWDEFRVGLELPGIPEFKLRVGRSQGRPAFRFVDLPSFPLWICSPTLERTFADDFHV